MLLCENMSAKRILQIMQFVADSNGPVTVTEASTHLRVPRATVYRLVTMLEKEDVLQRTPDKKRLEFSGSFLRSMLSAASNDQVVLGFREFLSTTADALGATAFLGRLNATFVELVHAIVPSDKSRPCVHPGLNVRPAHVCSSSRAILAFLPEREVTAILGSEYPAFNSKTIVDPEAVREELRLTKARGYAICDEEIDPGVTSVAVPAIVGKAGVLCSVGVVAATSKMHEFGLAAIGESLKDRTRRAVDALNRTMSEIAA